MLWPVLVPVAEIRFSVRGYLSLRLAKTEGTRKLQAETRPNSRPPPPSPAIRPWLVAPGAPKLPLHAGKKKVDQDHGRTWQNKSELGDASARCRVPDPRRNRTQHNRVRFAPPDGNGLAWLARSRRHELWRRPPLPACLPALDTDPRRRAAGNHGVRGPARPCGGRIHW
jgi:hypothetical protein